MALSIGIDYSVNCWQTCLMENGQVLALSTFGDAQATFSYVKQICASYPEPIITLSIPLQTTFGPFLNVASASELSQNDLKEFLIAANEINLRSYSLPAIKYLPGIPHYRKLNRSDMGSSDQLCAVATLLYRMRKQEAAWSEMRFLYLEADYTSRCITVIQDGCIVDGIRKTPTIDSAIYGDMTEAEQEKLLEQAFWEGLAQDLAGLMALHHFEDIVMGNTCSSASDSALKDAVIDRLGDTYQLYLFPGSQSEQEGFETAIGAAIIAEGLYRPGLAAEVTQRLLSPLA
ncbi:MAG: DUF1464 family protein [Chloroflexi bacterium]|nr:DUF1464 family protein [Chloroflexota bacterium]